MSRTRVALLAGAACVSVAALAPPASAATLVNGGFEDGTTAGWTRGAVLAFAASEHVGYRPQAGDHFAIVSSGRQCSDTTSARCVLSWGRTSARSAIPPGPVIRRCTRTVSRINGP